MSSLTRTTRRATSILLCMLLALGWFLANEATGDDEVTSPVKVGKLSRFPDDVRKRHKISGFNQASMPGQIPHGQIIVDAPLDTAYQIWTFNAHEKLGTSTLVAERDLETLSLK